MTRKLNTQRGFTLIEIIIAVMILAFSLTALLGLQSSATDQAIRTRNKQQAMLMARKIMSAIELQGAIVQNTKIEAPAAQVLQKFLVQDPQETKKEKTAASTELPLTANLTIEYWPVEGLPEKSIQKVSLSLFWSSNPADTIDVVYFIPAEVL